MIILTKNVHPSHDYRLKWIANDDALFFIYCCIFSEFLLFMFSFASLSSLILKSRFFSSCLFNLFPFSVQSANNLFCSQNDYLAETYLSHYSGPCKVSSDMVCSWIRRNLLKSFILHWDSIYYMDCHSNNK